MDESSNKLESLIKLAPFVMLAVVIVILIAMSQIPPSGPWVTDSVAPALPSLKYTHINESWGKNYMRADEQPAPTITEAPNSQPAPGLPKNDNSSHTYFASPRMLSARNAYREQVANQPVQQSSPQANPLPENTSPVDDLLHNGYLNDNHVVYEPAFGNASGSVRTQ